MNARDMARARRALERLSDEDREFACLIGRLPLVPWSVIGRLRGLGRSAVGDHLANLRLAGVIDSISGLSDHGHPACVPFLTELGLDVVAMLEGTGQPRGAPAVQGHPGADVYLWRLPQLYAIYRLVADIAAAAPGPVWVLACERPWWQRFRPLGSAGAHSVVLPARVVIQWPDSAIGEYLLLPDLGLVPPAAYGRTVAKLLRLGMAEEHRLPPLVISAPTPQRQAAWRSLLADTALLQREPELRACIGWAETLAAQLASTRDASGTASMACIRQRPRTPRLKQPEAPEPVEIKSNKNRPAGKPRLARSGLAERQLALLVLIGTTPCLTPAQVGVIAGLDQTTAYNHVRWLESRRLIGRVKFPAPGKLDRAELTGFEPRDAARFGLELTHFGLEVLAANHELPPHSVATHLGIAAPDDPEELDRKRSRRAPDESRDDRTRAARRRDNLVRILDHTRGVNRAHVRWVRDARARKDRGWDEAIVQWRPASRCGGPNIQPDAFVVYRRDGRRYGAFVEYDRGVETAPQYRRKFNAYWEYHDDGEYEREYEGFPAILIITVDKRAEDRIVRTLLRMKVGRSPLPVLVTNEERVRNDPAGFLGCVWRGSEPTFDTRCGWPELQTALPLSAAS